MLFVFILSIKSLHIHENDSDELTELFKRTKIQHPSATINKQDIQRARDNIEKHQWAKTIKRRILSDADKTIQYFLDDSVLDNMIPRTSPAALTFCPNCANKGPDYHPNGQWSWTSTDPDHLKCAKCGMVFPNDAYPEQLQYQSSWDPDQVITYVDNGPKKCMNYLRCYSSVNGMIRNYKLDYTIKRLTYLSQAYSLSNDVKYADATKRILLKLADRFPKYLVYCGYSYNQYADCDPHYAVQDLPNLPTINGKKCQMIVADPQIKTDTFFSDYWSAGRFGTSGSDGEYAEILALAYDLVADAVREDGTSVFSEEEQRHIEEDLLIESCLLGYFDKKINNKSTLNRKGCSIVGLVVGNAKLVHFGLEGYDRVFNEFFLKDGSTSQSVTYGLKTLLGFDGFNLAFRNYTDPSYFNPSVNETFYKNFNINKDTEYESLWHSLIWCLYYDTSYPIIGDQTHNLKFPRDYYEFLTNEFDHEYIQEFIGSIQSKQTLPNNNAIFLRDPDYEPYNGSFILPDIVYPYLQQGYIRTGQLGEESLLVLDASPGDGGHHHYDSLNILYTKYNKEMLLDLGYLLDHPNKSKTMATSAHNTVVIDGGDQITKLRGGQFHIFETTLDDTKVMQASSHPYKDADIYHRTIVHVEHEKGKNYIVDIFRSNGGSKRRELVFHGPNNDYKLDQQLTFNTPYDVIPVHGYFQFLVRGKESFEVAEISMKELNEDGTNGDELVLEINDQLFATNLTRYNCTEQAFFCGKNNKGIPLEFSIVDGPEKGKKAIKVFCNSEKSCSGSLQIGHDRNLLSLKDNSRYIVQFKTRGETFAQSIRLQMVERNQTSLVKQSLWEIDPTVWNTFKGYFDIGAPFSEALGTQTNDQVSIHWSIDEELGFSAFIPARDSQKVYFKNGWGQRFTNNSDFGATLPYFYFNRPITETVSTWVTVYEGYNKTKSIVKGVEAKYEENGNVVIKIDTNDGFDYVSSCFVDGTTVEGFGLKSDGKVAVINKNKPRLYDGKVLEFNSKMVEADATQDSGTVVGYGYSDKRDESWFDIEGNIDINSLRNGQVLFVRDEEGISRGYPIQKASNDASRSNRHRIYVKSNYKGFKAYNADSWHLTSLSTEFKEGSDDENNGNNQDSEGKGLSKGAIAAIVVVVIVVVIAAVVVGIIFYVKNKKNEASASEI